MDRYTPYAHCPCCFESSGYMGQIISATWTDPSYEDVDYSRRCPECDGTGMVECETRTLDDLEDEIASLDEYLNSLAGEHAEGRIGSTPITSEAPSILHHEAANVA